jgi:bacteriorhodopsin
MIISLNNYLNTYQFFTQTLGLSLGIQILTGIIEFSTLFIKVKPDILFLKDLLVVEFSVQIIELIFYIWLLINLNTVSNITSKRYIDWIITTPTMLFTLIMYLIYMKTTNKENLKIFDTINSNKQNILIILFLNLLMLIFGYLGETQQINKNYAVTFGFFPFILYFWLIFDNYAKYTDFGKKLFYYFFIVWSFYGIVAYLPYFIRNASYNILDLFAKNFFGLYLAYLIINNSNIL